MKNSDSRIKVDVSSLSLTLRKEIRKTRRCPRGVGSNVSEKKRLIQLVRYNVKKNVNLKLPLVPASTCCSRKILGGVKCVTRR